MSRTDKTQPWRNRIAEHPQEVHDHRSGPCDLPKDPLTYPDTSAVPKTWSCTRCYWDVQLNHLYDHHVCGCRMCTGYYERKWDNRKERYRGREQCRNWD